MQQLVLPNLDIYTNRKGDLLFIMLKVTLYEEHTTAGLHFHPKMNKLMKLTHFPLAVFDFLLLLCHHEKQASDCRSHLLLFLS